MHSKTFLGIELGSTRIKSVLIDEGHKLVASGGHGWENELADGIWTYSLDDVWNGLQASFAALPHCDNISAIGISAMMHGYLAFDKNDNLLVPFRTWRNTTTEQAANALTKEFGFNIPQRWSIAHFYQAILNEETHVKDVAFITTLAGYVHWKLTGEKVLGVGDASGMFPIDENGNYDMEMVGKFDALVAPSLRAPYHGTGQAARSNPEKVQNLDCFGKEPLAMTDCWTLLDILPVIKSAGQPAGTLTPEGAKLLDPSGRLQPGIPLCPPEGDAGTGMVATNSVAPRTGNVSAGTSIFAMLVLEKALSKVYMEIDMVTTPAGRPVAMVHCNNCCTDIDAWIKLFEESLGIFGASVDKNTLYETLYRQALEGEPDCGGILTYNYYSGEPITGFDTGRPLLIRKPDAKFSVANVMRSLLFSAIGTLKIGMDILEVENVQLDQLLGHGGFFKTPGVGQRIMAAALGVPITVMESAGEGGAWGIAILAAYMAQKNGETLEAYLAKVFAGEKGVTTDPCDKDARGFAEYMKTYVSGLAIERAAVEN